MSNDFVDHRFAKQILDLSNAYGSMSFWEENLTLQANPEVTWRAVLACGCTENPRYANDFMLLIHHPDSRVRAWSCYGLGRLKFQKAIAQLNNLATDPFFRVRYRARQALSAIGQSSHHRHPAFKNPLILISEDDQSFQKLIGVSMQRMGYITLFANTARETISLAQKHHPEIILTDNQKYNDNLSGIFMTSDLSRNSNTAHATIIMITADEIEPAFVWHGGDIFMPKQAFQINQVVRIVENSS